MLKHYPEVIIIIFTSWQKNQEHIAFCCWCFCFVSLSFSQSVYPVTTITVPVIVWYILHTTRIYVSDLSLPLGKHVSDGCMSENIVYYCFLLSMENMGHFTVVRNLIHKIYFPVWLWMFGCLKRFGVELNCLRGPYSTEKNGNFRILVSLLNRE